MLRRGSAAFGLKRKPSTAAAHSPQRELGPNALHVDVHRIDGLHGSAHALVELTLGEMRLHTAAQAPAQSGDAIVFDQTAVFDLATDGQLRLVVRSSSASDPAASVEIRLNMHGVLAYESSRSLELDLDPLVGILHISVGWVDHGGPTRYEPSMTSGPPIVVSAPSPVRPMPSLTDVTPRAVTLASPGDAGVGVGANSAAGPSSSPVGLTADEPPVPRELLDARGSLRVHVHWATGLMAGDWETSTSDAYVVVRLVNDALASSDDQQRQVAPEPEMRIRSLSPPVSRVLARRAAGGRESRAMPGGAMPLVSRPSRWRVWPRPSSRPS